MKSSLALTLTLTLASAGTTSNVPKIAWFVPSIASHRCGGPMGYLDHVCGTKAYCDAFDTARDLTDGFFDNSTNCYAAHTSPPSDGPADPSQQHSQPQLPWIAQGSRPRQCGAGPWPITDVRCGTQRYCEAHDSVAIVRADMPVGPSRQHRLTAAATTRRFVSAAQCFAAHAPNPSPAPGRLEPWVAVPAHQQRACGLYHYSEDECGTRRYCAAFDAEPELVDGRFASEAECLVGHLAAHEAAPADGGEPELAKLAWIKASGSAHLCKEMHSYDIRLCGTRIYCDAYDTDAIHTQRRFRSSAECYAAFEPEEAAAAA